MMRTPVPSEPRTFSLKDDTCFSGIRASAHPELVEGPNDRPLILSLSKDGERAAMREMVRRIEQGPSNRS